MQKKILVIILALAICSQSTTVLASSNTSGIEKTVLQVLQELSREYSIPSNVLSTMPKQYAEEAAKYDLTSAQMSELEKRLKEILLQSGDYIAEQDLDSIAGSVEYVVFLIKRDTTIASYQFPGDKPSDSARDEIAAMILDGKIPEAFQQNYQKPITVGQMAELFISQDTNKRYDKIKFVNDTINNDSPYYVKVAFLYGLIDSANELTQTMTREQAAVRISKTLTYNLGDVVSSKDFASISADAFYDVANIQSHSFFPLIKGNFEPKKLYTIEDAILGMEQYSSNKIRGLIPYLNQNMYGNLTVGNHFAYFDYDDPDDAREFIHNHIEPMMSNIKLTGQYQKIDAGYAIIELWAPDAELKFTFKNNVENLDFNDTRNTITYGRGVYSSTSVEGYQAEPRLLKAGEIVSMDVQPDSISKKLYEKLDPILAKIIKPQMTDVQKVKVIFDYVVNQISYSGHPNYLSSENALIALEKGKGVCVHYTILFHYMAQRSGIRTVALQGPSIVGQHAWNAVYLNGKWLFVDTTLADSTKGKIDYTYYLKDASFMFKTHKWTSFDYPDYSEFPTIDGMKISTTDEFRAYLLQQLWKGPDIPPKKITFKLTNNKVDTDIRFLRVAQFDSKYTMKLDKKTNVYTLTLTY